MPLFAEQKKTTGNVIAFDRACAEKLADACKAKGKIKCKYSLNAWAKAFSQLRTIDGIDTPTIRIILKWYIAHLGEPFIPQAYSGAGFRKKYDAIRQARDSSGDATPKVRLSGEGKFVLKSLANEYWPANALEQLPFVIQTSLDNWHQWQIMLNTVFNKLHAFAKHNGPAFGKVTRRADAISLIRLIAYIRAVAGRPIAFIANWMHRISWIVNSYKQWNGSLQAYAFEPRHALFKAIGCAWSMDFSSGTKRWFQLVECIAHV